MSSPAEGQQPPQSSDGSVPLDGDSLWLDRGAGTGGENERGAPGGSDLRDLWENPSTHPDDRLQSLADAEKRFDELTQEKLQVRDQRTQWDNYTAESTIQCVCVCACADWGSFEPDTGIRRSSEHADQIGWGRLGFHTETPSVLVGWFVEPGNHLRPTCNRNNQSTFSSQMFEPVRSKINVKTIGETKRQSNRFH